VSEIMTGPSESFEISLGDAESRGPEQTCLKYTVESLGMTS